MKYRAILIDPGSKSERPLQILSQHLADVERWALGDGKECRGVLASAVSPRATVEVYECAERHVRRIEKAGAPK